MSEKNLLDPLENELIPTEDPAVKRARAATGDLLNPANNEIIPNEDPANPPNDLCPGYVEPPKKEVVVPDLMTYLKDAAAGIFPAGNGGGCERVQVDLGGGLKASSCPAGGLSIFKDGVQVHAIDGLSAEDQAVVQNYRERNK